MSTKSSIIYAESDRDSQYCHVYTDTLERQDVVFIDIVDFGVDVRLAISKNLWNAIVRKIDKVEKNV